MAWVVAMLRCTYQNSPSSKHLDSPCLRTGSGGVIRYVYSIDHVTCSTYVCICAAAILAILVLSATFELTEWKGADQCSGVFIRFKSPNSLFNIWLVAYYVTLGFGGFHHRVLFATAEMLRTCCCLCHITWDDPCHSCGHGLDYTTYRAGMVPQK